MQTKKMNIRNLFCRKLATVRRNFVENMHCRPRLLFKSTTPLLGQSDSNPRASDSDSSDPLDFNAFSQ